MQIFFLSAADVFLAKSFKRLATGRIEKSAYPMVKDFSSHQEVVEAPEIFHSQFSSTLNSGTA